MRCETCQGFGRVVWPYGYRSPIPAQYEQAWARPCQDCGGGGIAHCCDGLQASDWPLCNDGEELA
jgi:hypothetical protein